MDNGPSAGKFVNEVVQRSYFLHQGEGKVDGGCEEATRKGRRFERRNGSLGDKNNNLIGKQARGCWVVMTAHLGCGMVTCKVKPVCPAV